MTRAQAIGLIAAALVVAVAVAVWPEIPRWRLGGTASIPAATVAHQARFPACPGTGATIVIVGDSHVAGSRMEEDGDPFGIVAERALGGHVRLTLFGMGGATAKMGEIAVGRSDAVQADLVILAYGTNDAAPRGWLRDRQPVPLADYKAAMTRQIRAWRRRGAQVAVMAPPPGGSAAINHRLAPYRGAARDIGRAEQVAVLDPAEAFASCAGSEPLLTHDALHMNRAGHQCLGQWLARRLCPAKPPHPPPDQSPSLGRTGRLGGTLAAL